MKIVIDIPESILNTIQADEMISREQLAVLQMHILKGTLLPKGHGRLIDADALEKKMCDREEELADDKVVWESSAVSVALSEFAPTIIEGETEEWKKLNERLK